MPAPNEKQLRERRSELVAKQAREGLTVDEAFELGHLNLWLGEVGG